VNWSELRTLIRLRLRDPNAVIWSDSVLLSYANRTIEEITRNSEGHIKHATLNLTSGTRSYTLPNDFFELRDVNINGRKIFGKQAYELEDLDQVYLTATGTPEYYYQEDSKTLSFYKIPSWTSSYTTFTQELGEVVSWLDGSTYFSVNQEFGCVTDIISDADEVYLSESLTGEVVAVDSGKLVCTITYVYQPEYLVNDEDEPDFKVPYQYLVVYGALEKSFRREGQGKNERMATRYASRRIELEEEFLARQKELAHGKDQIIGMVQMSYGAERDYSMRVWR
jgi:hypothetical protein